jgi:pilus assembly protein CpaF
MTTTAKDTQLSLTGVQAGLAISAQPESAQGGDPAQSEAFSIVLRFLDPIADLVLDHSISEIMINGPGQVFVERAGHLEAHPEIKIDQNTLETAVTIIARKLGDDFSEKKPILDARLPDGSRVAAVRPPCSLDGITLTIRKFNNRRWTLHELVKSGCIPEQVLNTIRDAIRTRKNILISGGTGTGKTTMLNALASLIPNSERLVVIEDTAEIHLTAPNLVRFEARRGQQAANPEDEVPKVEIRQLLRATLRHRPDRIIVGEIRGGEAFDLLQALNTGHSGTLSTIHANSAGLALMRFASCVLEAGVELPFAAICTQIAASLHYVVQIDRKQGRREVAQLIELRGYDIDAHAYQTATLYDRDVQPATARDLATLAHAVEQQPIQYHLRELLKLAGVVQ